MTRPTRPRTTLLRRASLAGLAAGASLAIAPTALATFPGGNGLIAFQRGGDIYTVNPDGTDERQLTSGPAVDGHPEWSPDGRSIIFDRRSDDRPSDVYRMAADGSGAVKLFAGYTPEFSGDGKRIAFSRDDKLMVADADGSGERVLESFVFLVGVDDWSPTHSLILHSLSDGDTQFGARSPGGLSFGFGQVLHDDRHLDNLQPEFSPDGTKIAFNRNHSGIGPCNPGDPTCPFDPDIGLNVMDIGAEDRRVIHPRGTQPAWSPDGQQIAYVNGDALQVIRADGTGRRTLVKGMQPDWQPVAAKAPARPGPETVTVAVPVEVPGPVRVVEKVVSRSVQDEGAKCVIPAERRKLTLVIRATRAIKAGAGVKLSVRLAHGGAKVKVPRGKPFRAGAR